MLLAASLLLHALAFQWANGRIGLPSASKELPVVITTQLYVPPPPPPPPPKPRLKPKPKAARPKPQPAPPMPVPVPAMETQTQETVAVDDGTSDIIAAALGDLGAEDMLPPEPTLEFAAVEEANAPRYTVSPPPSAQLSYDVSATHEGQNWYGNGLFRWESSADSYRITGEASVRLIVKFSVLNFGSQGSINEFGIAPALYTEQTRRKPLTQTHFQPGQEKIVFSASSASHPYHGGEQDRASIMWQLAAIGRGDAGQFRPGEQFDIVVAGARRAETWRISVVGEEEIETGHGRFSAWHVMRAPTPGSDEQQIDIWFAKDHQWYPVKVRYTETNGDHLEMSLSEMEPIPPVSLPTENP